jgi:hypothetical protein avisC_02045
MTDVIALAGIAASLLKLVLRLNDESEAVELIGDAQEAASYLGRLKRRKSDIPKSIPHRIEERLQAKLHGMYDRCVGQGIDVNSLEHVATEVAILLEEMAQQKSLLVTAVRSPEDFPNLLKSHAVHRRSNVEERLEPYFDDLVIAVAKEYAQLAPWSPYFQEQSFNAVFDQIENLRELEEKHIQITQQGMQNLKEEVHDVKEEVHAVKEEQSQIRRAIEDLPLNHATQTRIFFGKRPSLAAHFTKRIELEQLHKLTLDEACPRTVLVGMRGTGKSQLAANIAQWCETSKWKLVAWIDAADRKAIKNALVDLGTRLGLKTTNHTNPNNNIQLCLDTLRASEFDNRLLVFDNVEDINDLTDLIPVGAGLRVIATTTNSIGWTQQSWQTINVGMLTQKEASSLLLKHTKSQDENSANKIAELLGGLPLAIAQAAATTSNNNWSLKQYLEQFKKYSSDITLLRVPGDSYEYETSLAIALAIESALAKLEDNIQIAARYILNCLTILAHSGVPTDWLLSAPNNEHTDTDFNDEPTLQHTALTSLINTSIIQKSEDSSVTKLHRLQAQVWRENWNSEEKVQAFESALQLIGTIDKERMFTSDRNIRYTITRNLISQFREITHQPHSRELFEDHRIQECIAYILNPAHDLGLHYEQIGLHDAVNIVTTSETVNTITSIHCKIGLSNAYRKAKYTSKAIDLSESALADCEQSLPADDSLILTCNSILAESYRDAHRTSEALEIFKQVYLKYKKLCAPYRLEVLNALNDLAQAYLDDGNPSAAIYQFDRLINYTTRFYASDQTLVLGYRNNRASAYQKAGQLTDAISEFQDIYDVASTLLSNDDPDKYLYLNNLAGAYLDSGNATKAIEYFELLKQLTTKHLITNHPIHVDFRFNLVKAYFAGGRKSDALHELQALVDFSEKVIPNSPSTTQLRKMLEDFLPE